MTHLKRLRPTSLLNWVSSNLSEHHSRFSETPFQRIGSFYIAQNPRRFYARKRKVKDETCPDKASLACDKNKNGLRVSTPVIREAEAALLEYLHSTRSFHFMDAEHISRNSPFFLQNILEKIKDKDNVRQSTVRYFRYDPINEFEPFFESIGLKPCEYTSFLPRSLLFLKDDPLLLENYHVLCEYCIERNKIGVIYKKAMEVFRYDYGVLLSKIRSFEELGISRSFLRKVIFCSPRILIGDANVEFISIIQMLKKMGIDFSSIEEHLEPDCSWRMMFSLIRVFSCIDCYEEETWSRVIKQNPGLIFENSGDRSFTLIVLLLKFGFTMDKIYSVFLEFPQMQVGKFVLNFRQCVLFLNEIEMEANEIINIIHSHPVLLGSCNLKKTDSLLVSLNVGKKRLCKYIQKNPLELKKWVMGTRVKPLPNSGMKERSQLLKNKFLLELGFVENSKQMQKAMKLMRASGEELQERFDCIVNAGLDKKDVVKMIFTSPHILNQKTNIMQMKIDFLVNESDYPLSYLTSFPSYLTYTVERIKSRSSMYNWLRVQGVVDPNLALSTLLTCADSIFIKRYVELHPKGPLVWQDLMKICSR